MAVPLTAGATAHALGAEGALLASIVLICAVPTAPSSYVLASRMGGDTRLMASITGVQTLLAIVTLPIPRDVKRAGTIAQGSKTATGTELAHAFIAASTERSS